MKNTAVKCLSQKKRSPSPLKFQNSRMSINEKRLLTTVKKDQIFVLPYGDSFDDRYIFHRSPIKIRKKPNLPPAPEPEIIAEATVEAPTTEIEP